MDKIKEFFGKIEYIYSNQLGYSDFIRICFITLSDKVFVIDTYISVCKLNEQYLIIEEQALSIPIDWIDRIIYQFDDIIMLNMKN